MNLKKATIIFLSLLIFYSIQAQKLNLGVEGGSGFILAHSSNNLHLVQSHPSKFEISLQNQKIGNKEWHHIYNLPKVDHSLIMVDYHNEILGKTYAYTLQLAYPFLKAGNFKAMTDIGFGIGYNTKKFNRVDNYKNNVLSSTLTGSLHAKIYGEYKLSQKLNMDIGIGLIHFSNGSFTVPNWGINVPYAQIGLLYGINQVEVKEREVINLKDEEGKKWGYSAEISNGFKDVYPTGGVKHWYNTIGLRGCYTVNKIYKIYSGLDGFYDRSVKERRKEDGFDDEGNYYTKIGLFIGQELKIGDFSVGTHFGKYLYQAYFSTYANGYQRYQVKYHFKENYYTGVGMKLHKGAADVIEFTIGIEI